MSVRVTPGAFLRNTEQAARPAACAGARGARPPTQAALGAAPAGSVSADQPSGISTSAPRTRCIKADSTVVSLFLRSPRLPAPPVTLTVAVTGLVTETGKGDTEKPTH